MKWLIPAKTFLVGEYAAVEEGSAIILTTQPCFELALHANDLNEIHPHSPAGIWWEQNNFNLADLMWMDPYRGRGGLGASSAQFLASYLASCIQQNTQPVLTDLLEAYYKVSWSGQGIRPSGYDVIAQSQHACVFINKQQKIIESFAWVFNNLSFYIVHTGIKLATHEHLKMTSLPTKIQDLSSIADKARNSFVSMDDQLLIKSINEYHNALKELNLVHSNTLSLIDDLKQNPRILAIKGCGALGTDTLFILTEKNNAQRLEMKLNSMGLTVLATEHQLTSLRSPTLIDAKL